MKSLIGTFLSNVGTAAVQGVVTSVPPGLASAAPSAPLVLIHIVLNLGR